MGQESRLQAGFQASSSLVRRLVLNVREFACPATLKLNRGLVIFLRRPHPGQRFRDLI